MAYYGRESITPSRHHTEDEDAKNFSAPELCSQLQDIGRSLVALASTADAWASRGGGGGGETKTTAGLTPPTSTAPLSVTDLASKLGKVAAANAPAGSDANAMTPAQQCARLGSQVTSISKALSAVLQRVSTSTAAGGGGAFQTPEANPIALQSHHQHLPLSHTTPAAGGPNSSHQQESGKIHPSRPMTQQTSGGRNNNNRGGQYSLGHTQASSSSPRQQLPQGPGHHQHAKQHHQKAVNPGAGGSGGIAASVLETKRILPATLYLCLEAVVKAVHAESGAIFLPRNDEMVSVVNVSTKLAFPPSLLRHMTTNALTGGVYASGVAIHQENYEEVSCDDNERKLRSLLIFPIIGPGGNKSSSSSGPGGKGATAKNKQQGGSPSGSTVENRIGVIQVANKRRGTARFDKKDENVVNSAAFCIAQIMERQDFDWHSHYYDPITLHNLSPFVPAPAAHSVMAKQPALLGEELLAATKNNNTENNKKQLLDPKKGTRAAGGAKATPSATPTTTALEDAHLTSELITMDQCVPSEFIPPKLIHRTTIPVSLHRRNNLKEDSTMLDSAPSLIEIDSYLVNLEDCWRRAVQLNAVAAQNDAVKVSQLKKVREELNKQKTRSDLLTEDLRLSRLDAGDYLDEYQNLKTELISYLDQPAQQQGGGGGTGVNTGIDVE